MTAVVGLLMPQMVSAEETNTKTITYDFTTMATANLTAGNNANTSIGGNATYYATNGTDALFDNLLSFQFRSGNSWAITNGTGLVLTRSNDERMAILGLRAGDKISITHEGWIWSAYSGSDPSNMTDKTVFDVNTWEKDATRLASGTEYEVESDGACKLVFGSGTTITSIVIKRVVKNVTFDFLTRYDNDYTFTKEDGYTDYGRVGTTSSNPWLVRTTKVGEGNFKNQFAFEFHQYSGTRNMWKITKKGLAMGRESNNSWEAFAVTNLNAGDRVTINFTGTIYRVDNSYNSSLGTITSGTAYTMDAAGDMYFAASTAINITSINIEKAIPVSIGYATLGTQQPADLSALDAYIITGNSGDKLTYQAVGKVPANTGVIIKAENGTLYAPVYDFGTEDMSGNLLVASTGYTVLSTDNIYVLTQSGSTVGFGHAAENLNIPAGKAYLSLPSGSNARSFFAFDFGNETTSINEGISMKNETSTAAQYYTLGGQRVAQPAKGLYIVNGKKVIIK